MNPYNRFQEILWFLDRNSTLPMYEIESVGITPPHSAYRIRRPDGVDFYTFEYVVSGHGVLRFETETFHPEPGDCWLLPAHVPVEYYSDRRDPWKKLWINVGGALPESLVTVYQLQQAVLLRQCPLEKEFRHALELVRTRPENVTTEFALALHRITAGMAAHRDGAVQRRGSLPALRLKRYLEDHWREKVRLDDLAKLIERSPAQTLRIFTREWGMTPGEWLTRHRFEFARQYLDNTQYTIRTIAEMVGFKDEFYFANWFKQHAGIAPGQFRRRTR